MKKTILGAFTLLLSLLLLVTSCTDNSGIKNPNTNPNTNPNPSEQPGVNSWATGELPTGVTLAESDLSVFDLEFSNKDVNHEIVPLNPTTIVFSVESVKINNSKAGIEKDGAVHIYSEGTYVLSGYSPNARIVVDASQADKITLLFNGLTLHSPGAPALYVKAADKVTINLVKGTENKLSDGNSYTCTDGTTTLDAALFSKDDLAINGQGKLTVDGNNKHGIVSKDDLVITGGTINVSAKGAAIEGKDCVKIGGGVLTLIAGSDAIRADNATDAQRGFVYIKDATLTTISDGDGIQAANAVIIDGGNLTVTTNGTTDPNTSSKGMKSDSDIVIKGGTVTVSAQEDAINSKKSVIIAGGTLALDAIDDAIQADLDVIVRGGRINVNFANKAIKAQDVVIAGGTHTLLSDGDGINAVGESTAEISAGNIAVSGGYLYVSAKKDCLDANTSIYITGGVTLIDGESSDKNVTLNANVALTVSGGVLFATGSSDTVKNVTAASNQGVMKVHFDEQTAGTPLVVCDKNGTAIVSFIPTKNYSAAIISAPELQNGNTYTLYTDGIITDDANEYGFATNAPYTNGSDLMAVTFTTNFYKQPKK